MMKTRLLKIEKVDKNNIYTEIEHNDSYVQKEYWWKYSKDEVLKALRRDCNCTIPKQFA